MAKNIEELQSAPIQKLDITQFPKRAEVEEEKGTAEQEAANTAFDVLTQMTQDIEEQNEEIREEIKEENEVNEFIGEENEDSTEEDTSESEDVEDEFTDEESDDEDVEEENTSVDLSDISDDEFDEDLKELLGETSSSGSSVSTEEYINSYKSAIKEKIKPISETMDISSFSIVNEPISINATLEESNHDDVSWVLYSSGRSVHMERYLGSDIEDLNPDTNASGNGRFDTLRKVYRSLYEHITDTNKPASFEAWLKSTSYLDIKNLYATVYRGAFEGSNYMTYECTDPSCGHIWLSDDVPFMDIVEFDNDEIKDKFMELLEKESSEMDKLYVSEVVPISPKYAISFREPSIYNVVFENASLPQKFSNKYEGMLSILMYIDSIYYIDAENKRLQPIALKTFNDSVSKTTRFKVYTYSKILRELDSDQYNSLAKYMLSINKRAEAVKYVKPACTCPKCGKEVPKEEQDIQSMLFNRASLVSILNA